MAIGKKKHDQAYPIAELAHPCRRRQAMQQAKQELFETRKALLAEHRCGENGEQIGQLEYALHRKHIFPTLIERRTAYERNQQKR